MSETGERRPIKARSTRWANAVTRLLLRVGMTPNSISVASVGFALVSAAALIGSRFVAIPWVGASLFIAAALGVQCRLLCNLFDGMVAVEGGKAGKAGEIFNDFPDRIADPMILVAAGHAGSSLPFAIELGWAAAAFALLTAYTRVLGKSVGAGTYFAGPMAKQHRMAIMTAACVISAGLVFRGWHPWAFVAALGLIVLGCVVTVVRRLRLIVGDLHRT